VALAGIHRIGRGAERALEALADGLARAPATEVTVMGTGPEMPGRAYAYRQLPVIGRERFASMPAIPLLRSPCHYEEMTFAPGLWRAFNPDAFDVTLTCSYPFTNWVLRTKRGCSTRPAHVFVTENGDWPLRRLNSEYRFFDCDGLVCTNPAYRDAHCLNWPTRLIPNGLDPELFRPAPQQRQALGLPDNCPLVLMVSALTDDKRVREGIRCVGGLDDAFLVVAGDGPARAACEEEARQHLGDRWRFVSMPAEQMPMLYQSADVLLHMRPHEAFGNIYIEAAACGTVVVAPDDPTTRWLLPHATRVDVTDDQAVVSALRQALDAGRRDAGAAARLEASRDMRNRFSWESVATRYRDFLATTAADRTAKPLSQKGPRRVRQDLGNDIGIVVIGRNEGERFARCLASLRDSSRPLVYVDSGSTDGSCELAQNAGATLVQLDLSTPFSMARARNAGVAALLEQAPDIRYVQFIDGDCTVAPGWIETAAGFLDAHPSMAAVAGRRREQQPEASAYNQMCDIEWDAPVGVVHAVGGDAMMRVEAFEQAGGFATELIAGEEPELSARMRRCGWQLSRLETEMTSHDAALHTFSQWWRRTRRCGYGSLDVVLRCRQRGWREDIPFSGVVRSTLVWTVAWFLASVAAACAATAAWGTAAGAATAGAAVGLWFAQALRCARREYRRGTRARTAITYSALTMIGKWAQLCGHAQCAWHRLTGRRARLIEYKKTAAAPPSSWELDRRRYGRRAWLREQSLWAVAVLRFGQWADKRQGRASRWLMSRFYWTAYRLVETLTGISIGKKTAVGGGLRIHHFGGIVVHPDAQIGTGCTLRHGVTIGERHAHGGTPRVGNDVEFGAYAQVLGPVRIGDGATIGALSVVMQDVPAGATAVGSPARILHRPTASGAAA
jgi:serine acetyltransferase/glycosyltransferase involved in cell wall biosynthesis/GT2 family glycosyltransferase